MQQSPFVMRVARTQQVVGMQSSLPHISWAAEITTAAKREGKRETIKHLFLSPL